MYYRLGLLLCYFYCARRCWLLTLARSKNKKFQFSPLSQQGSCSVASRRSKEVSIDEPLVEEDENEPSATPSSKSETFKLDSLSDSKSDLDLANLVCGLEEEATRLLG